MYEIYINPGPRGSTFGGGYVRRDKNFTTRIAGPETSAAVIGENDEFVNANSTTLSLVGLQLFRQKVYNISTRNNALD